MSEVQFDGIKEEWLGYYGDAAEFVPTFDPDTSAPCLICRFQWTKDTVRTISIVAVDGDRIYFYRVHRKCRDAQSPTEQDALNGEVAELSRRQT